MKNEYQYVYIIKTREFINKNEDTYKIGKTKTVLFVCHRLLLLLLGQFTSIGYHLCFVYIAWRQDNLWGIWWDERQCHFCLAQCLLWTRGSYGTR